MDVIAVILLCALVIYQGWFIFHIHSIHIKRESDLLNRIMASNYPTYVNGEIVKDQNKNTPPDHEEEWGIPVT